MLERFFEKIDIDENRCWLWMATVTHDGYGRFSVNCKTLRAHRVAYALFYGELS